MENLYTGKVSQKGQVVIPAPIRKALDLKKETKVLFKVKNNDVRIKKLPSALDWADLVSQILEEKVEIDKNGHYDPKKSPDFHDWMVNG